MEIFTIVQARLNSTRLPKKVLLPFRDSKNVLEFMIERIEEFNPIIATTYGCNEIVEIAKSYNLRYFIGDEYNVLDRFYKSAIKFGAKNGDTIIRVCSDSPFLTSDIIQKVLKQFNGEYTHNLDDTKGLNLEVFSFECLKKAYFNAKSDFEKEHVTPWIKVNCKNKNVKLNFGIDEDLTLDTKEDYDRLLKVKL